MKNTYQKTKPSRIDKLCQACVAYAEGKKTLDQVHYFARGQRILMDLHGYPDRQLRQLVYELCMDFYTSFGVNNKMIARQVLALANYVSRSPQPERILM